MRLHVFRMILQYVVEWGTTSFRTTLVKLIPVPDIQNVLKMVDTMHKPHWTFLSQGKLLLPKVIKLWSRRLEVAGIL